MKSVKCTGIRLTPDKKSQIHINFPGNNINSNWGYQSTFFKYVLHKNEQEKKRT